LDDWQKIGLVAGRRSSVFGDFVYFSVELIVVCVLILPFRLPICRRFVFRAVFTWRSSRYSNIEFSIGEPLEERRLVVQYFGWRFKPVDGFAFTRTGGVLMDFPILFDFQKNLDDAWTISRCRSLF
jgi:hypothetical protein